MLLRKLQAMKAKKGFTLVELIVVIAIIAVLAAILIPILLNYLTSSRVSTADSNAKNVHSIVAAAITEMEGRGDALPAAGTAEFTKGVATAVWASTYANVVPVVAALNRDFPNVDGSAQVLLDAAGTPVSVVWLPNTNAANFAGITPSAAGVTGPARTRTAMYGCFPSHILAP